MAGSQHTTERPTGRTTDDAFGVGRSGADALEVSNLEVVYNDVILVLRGISIRVAEGSIAALLGANGAGKTTLLRAVSGLLEIHRGDITKGAVRLGGDDITALDPAARVARGVAQVMEGRRVFANLTVEENLRTGTIASGDGKVAKESIDNMFDRFPLLGRLRQETAGYLSGGEQQMLAIGRALMSRPSMLLLDEPSLGLAPKIVEQIRNVIVEVNQQGASVLLVEQNAAMALSIAHHGYVMEHGRIVRDGAAGELLDDRDIAEFYLGGGPSDHGSYRTVKTYRRRKSWGS